MPLMGSIAASGAPICLRLGHCCLLCLQILQLHLLMACRCWVLIVQHSSCPPVCLSCGLFRSIVVTQPRKSKQCKTQQNNTTMV